MNQPTPNFWPVIGMIVMLFALLVAGIHKGDPAQVIEYPSGMKPCVGGFGDWPESYDMECE